MTMVTWISGKDAQQHLYCLGDGAVAAAIVAFAAHIVLDILILAPPEQPLAHDGARTCTSPTP